MSAFRLGEKYERRRSPWLKRLFLGMLAIVILAVIAGIIWFRQNIQPLDSENATTYSIIVPIGATEAAISEELEEQGIIRSAVAYRLQARLSGKQGTMQAGEYEVSSTQSVDEILTLFESGRVNSELITILPAQRIAQIEQAFLDAGFSQLEVTEALDPDTYSDHPIYGYIPAGGNLEGYLYPESFQRTKSTLLTDIVRQSLDLMNDALSRQRIDGIIAQGLTVHEGVILASIIEEEVSDLDDKPIVAQVFLKRLAEGIPLGSDPTGFYGDSLNGVEEAIFNDNPYNTRLYEGLPPGPISNVTVASLDAVISPSNTDYLYFVSGDDGTTYFSNTLAEHEENTARYCTELCQ